MSCREDLPNQASLHIHTHVIKSMEMLDFDLCRGPIFYREINSSCETHDGQYILHLAGELRFKNVYVLDLLSS